MTKEQLERRYMALALTSYGDDVQEDQKELFLKKIKHMEHRIAATQHDIGVFEDPKYDYSFELTNTSPIKQQMMRYPPHAEKWLEEQL